MELVFTIIIIISILLFVLFGIPTIYDWIIYRGNHLSFINPKTRTTFRGGGSYFNPTSFHTLFGIFFLIFIILFIIKSIFG
jgi:hypothetical protein